jgi:hypothetical protein
MASGISSTTGSGSCSPPRAAPLPRTPKPRLFPKSPQSGPRRRHTRSLQAVLPLTLALYIAQYLNSLLKAGVKAVEWDRTTAPRLGHRLAATPCHLTRSTAK